jgi:6-phosphofructokinase
VTKAVLKNIETLGLDYLVAIGGDDTLSYAAELDRQGVKVIAVPKTMDNDVRNTEYCIGFSTAITRAMDAIERQRTTVGSHERIGLFRVFGRDAGYTALYTAYVTSLRCCIPEYKVNLQEADRAAGHRQEATTPATTRWRSSPRAPSGKATR